MLLTDKTEEIELFILKINYLREKMYEISQYDISQGTIGEIFGKEKEIIQYAHAIGDISNELVEKIQLLLSFKRNFVGIVLIIIEIILIAKF
jgi:hypothetical protein